MNAMQIEIAVAAINALDLDQLKAKLMHPEAGEGWSKAHVDAVETEYRRFLILMKLYPNEMTAPVVDVDTFWHYHILDTFKYATDCASAFGYFLHHYPYLGLRGEDDVANLQQAGARMQELYAATFGSGVQAGAAAWCGAATASPAQAGPAWCGAATASPAAQAPAWCGAAIASAADQAPAWCGAASGVLAGQAPAWCGAATAAPVVQAAPAWCGAATASPVGQAPAWCGAATASPAGQAPAWCGAASGVTAGQAPAWCGAATSGPAGQAPAWCGAATANAA